MVMSIQGMHTLFWKQTIHFQVLISRDEEEILSRMGLILSDLDNLDLQLMMKQVNFEGCHAVLRAVHL